MYDDLSADDVTAVCSKLNNNVDRILNDFGLNTNSEGSFKVHIWHDKTNFLDAMEKSLGYRYDNATGYLGYSAIYILLIDNPEPMINATGLLYCFTTEEIAEHELAHSLSLRLNFNFSDNSRWFWETVAIYESEEFYDPGSLSYLKAGDYPTIDELDRGFDDGDYKIYITLPKYTSPFSLSVITSG